MLYPPYPPHACMFTPACQQYMPTLVDNLIMVSIYTIINIAIALPQQLENASAYSYFTFSIYLEKFHLPRHKKISSEETLMMSEVR